MQHPFVKMCFINVGGLINKTTNRLEDKFFMNTINKYDIVFLAETHVGYNFEPPPFNHFHVHLLCRPVTKKINRHFGGLAILTQTSLKPHVKILNSTSSDFQWIKLEKTFFGLKNDLFQGRRRRGQGGGGRTCLPTFKSGGGGHKWVCFPPPPPLLGRANVLISLFAHILWLKTQFFQNFLGSLRSPTLINQYFLNFANLKL